MKKLLRRILFVALLLLIVGAVALYFVPYQNFAEHKIKSTLETMGLKVKSLKISELDTTHITLSELQIGDEQPLNIAQISLEYLPKEVIKGKFRNVAIDQLKANIYNKDGAWQVGGLEAFNKPNPNPDANPQLDFNKLQNTIPAAVKLSNSQVSAAQGDIALQLPFDFALNNSAEKISGNLTSKNLVASGLPYNIPPLDMKIDYAITAKNIAANIDMRDKGGQYLANMDFTALPENPQLGTLKIKQLKVPYGGGSVSVAGVNVPINLKSPIPVRLNLQNIDLATLLGEVSDGKVGGTGKISGVLPIVYHPDGSITLQQGNASASDKGTLTMAPDLLPGDNPGVVMARKTLENFHYTTLKIMVSSDKDNKSTIQLSLEGNNPDANEGRPVKLNVKIAGDVLPLIQQSLLSINDLKELMHLENTKEKK